MILIGGIIYLITDSLMWRVVFDAGSVRWYGVDLDTALHIWISCGAGCSLLPDELQTSGHPSQRRARRPRAERKTGRDARLISFHKRSWKFAVLCFLSLSRKKPSSQSFLNALAHLQLSFDDVRHTLRTQVLTHTRRNDSSWKTKGQTLKKISFSLSISLSAQG